MSSLVTVFAVHWEMAYVTSRFQWPSLPLKTVVARALVLVWWKTPRHRATFLVRQRLQPLGVVPSKKATVWLTLEVEWSCWS